MAKLKEMIEQGKVTITEQKQEATKAKPVPPEEMAQIQEANQQESHHEQPELQNNFSVDLGVISDGSHIDDIQIGEEFADDGTLCDETGAKCLTKAQFFEAFKGMFNIAGGFTRLSSLPVSEGDIAARDACDAIYDTAAEVSYLRFLIEPSNIWVQRSLVIVAFTLPKYMAVKAELQHRRAEAAKEVKETNEVGDDGQTIF